nr:hypothetical protein [Tanacetum cinerariifolium]
MSAKCTSWNEFSSAMASAVICLSTDVSGDDVQDHFIPSPAPPTPPPSPQAISSTSYEALDAYVALTRRVEHLEHNKVAQDPEITKLRQGIESSDDTIMEDVINQGRMIDELDKDEGVTLMGKKEEEKKAEEVKVISDDAQVEGRQAEIQAEIYQIDMDHPSKVLSMHEKESIEVQEVVEVVTTATLITDVVTAASTPVSAASTIIPAAEPKVPAATITAAPVKVVATSTRRRRGVVIRDPEEESTAITPADTKSKDKGKGIMAKFNANMKFILKSKEQIEEEENRALESINETPAQKAAKRRRLNKEDKDVEEIKQHLEIVPDEDDDVYTGATSLARKVPVVDYQIIHLNNKPRYKIIRADGTHQL